MIYLPAKIDVYSGINDKINFSPTIKSSVGRRERLNMIFDNLLNLAQSCQSCQLFLVSRTSRSRGGSYCPTAAKASASRSPADS